VISWDAASQRPSILQLTIYYDNQGISTLELAVLYKNSFRHFHFACENIFIIARAPSFLTPIHKSNLPTNAAMHLQPILLIPILAIGTLANKPLKITKDGVDSYLLANSLATGERVATEVYEKCREKNRDGVQINAGEKCLWNAVVYMIEALRDAHSFVGIALLSNTVNNMQSIADISSVNVTGPLSPSSSGSVDFASTVVASATTTPPLKLKRQDSSAKEVVWADLNDQIRRRSEGEHRPRAVHVGPSNLHPTDGLAVRTNVRSGDATLHVHTNGSHATAAFTKDSIPSLGRRDAGSTTGPEFQFEGSPQGLKVQLKVLDQNAYDILLNLTYELGLGKDGLAPKLKGSDSWALALCNNLSNKQTLWGRLIAEDNGAGDEYEEEGLINCDELSR
jgi:hypothetical protein